MYVNVFAVPVLIAAAITVSLIFAIRHYRSVAGVKAFMVSLVASVVYSIFYALEISSTNPEIAWFFYRLEYLGIPLIPAFYLIFSLGYTGNRNILNIPVIFAILILPVTTTLLVFTNSYHEMFLTSWNLSHNGWFVAAGFVPAFWYWIFQAWSIAAFLVSAVLFFVMWRNSAPVFRNQILIILFGSLIPFVVYLAYLLRLFPWGLDPIPFTNAFIAIAVYYGLARYNLFGLAPLARNLLFDKIPDIVVVMDQKPRIVDCNVQAMKMLKITTQDIGKNVVSALEDLPGLLAAIRTIQPGNPEELSLTINDSPMEFQCSVTDIHNAKGSRLGSMMIMHDITRRKMVERMQRETEEKFRLIVENAPLGVIYYDQNGVIRICNDQFVKIIGSSREKLIGLNMFQLPDKRVSQILTTALAGEKAGFEGFYKSTTADKTTPVRVLFEAIFNEEGQVTGGIGIIEDITERMATEEKIKSKNQQLEQMILEKDRFFSIIAHDLRSPFNAFLGFSELMTDDSFELTLDEMKGYAKDIRNSALLLFDLLENLLEWSRLQRSNVFMEKMDYPLIRIVTQSIDSLNENARKKEINLNIDFDRSLTVFVDEKMIQSVFRNLLSNAIKFTFRGGNVFIKASKKASDMVLVEISDTGIGIKPEVIPKLFRIDESVNTTGTEAEPSTGLGLILCKEFLDKNGGSIWVNSEAGVGTTFSFTLPVKEINLH